LSFLLRLGEKYTKQTANENRTSPKRNELHQMVAVYRQCDYVVSELPKVTLPARAQFILEQLRLLA
jgi:hypothetical protein